MWQNQETNEGMQWETSTCARETNKGPYWETSKCAHSRARGPAIRQRWESNEGTYILRKKIHASTGEHEKTTTLHMSVSLYSGASFSEHNVLLRCACHETSMFLCRRGRTPTVNGLGNEDKESRGTQKPRCEQIFVNDCQRTACPSSLQAGACGRHWQTDNAAIAAAWIVPFCYGPLRASKRNVNPGRGSRNYIVATSHGLSPFLGASCGLYSAKRRLPSTCPKGITSCEHARSLCL